MARKSRYETREAPDSGRRIAKNVEEGTNQRVLAHSLDVSRLKANPVDINNPDEVSSRIREYFELCMANDMKPTIPELGMAFGHGRDWLLRIVQGRAITLNDISMNYFKSAYDMINGQLEQYMLNGDTNVVAGIFIAKNNFGYKDQQETVVAHTIDVKKSVEQLTAEAQMLLE